MTACEKDTLASIFAPKVETGTAENIYRKGATLSGSIQFSEGMTAESYGILFSNFQSMAEYQEIPVTSGETDFSVSLQDLEPNETYYFCSYANSGYSMIRGEVRSFTTSSSNAPVFQTPVVSDTTDISFHITATLLDDGGSELMLSGFCYSEYGEKLPTFMDQVKNIELSGSSISATITGLYPSTTYQIRAYGASSNGLAYSDLVTVTTGTANVPFLSSVSQKDSTLYSVTLEASVLESGSAEVTEKGFCYSTSNQQPTVDDNRITVQNQSNTFETELENLSPQTTYYVRAYAVNEFGIGYSEVFTFTTADAKAPTLSAITKTASTDFSVSIKAEVTDAGTSEITKAGFCWSTTNETPTTDDTKKELEGPTLETTLENLTPNTTYYIRAYATNGFGTSYSGMFTFKTAAKDVDNGNTDINGLPIIKW